MTNPNDYLSDVLKDQDLEEGSDELKRLREERDRVERMLRDKLDSSTLTIRYGGSKAKRTMIREAYDLDVICYRSCEVDKTLEEIYDETRDALRESYKTVEKGSAVRLRSLDNADFHIDVVPGRFVDKDKGDAFLHRTTGDKSRLKTNLQKHIDHVHDSGVVDAIRLMKLWRCRHSLGLKHFALELITIELLQGKKSDTLSKQLTHIWTELRDAPDDVSIVDPANPQGNDLSEMWSQSIRNEVSEAARRTLNQIEREGWEAVFGRLKKHQDSKGLIEHVASQTQSHSPWRR